MKRIGLLAAVILAVGVCVPAAAQFASGFKPPPAVDAAWFSGRGKPQLPRNDKVPSDTWMVKPRVAWLDGDPAHFIPAQPEEPDAEKLAIWRRDVTNGAKDQEPHFMLALAEARAHRWGEAMKLLNDQLKVHYASYPALSLRAAIEAGLGRDDLAVEDLEAADAWRTAWRHAGDNYMVWDLHDTQEPYLRAMMAASLARLGRMDDKNGHWGAKGALDQVQRQVKAKYGFADLKILLARAEGAVAARTKGLDAASLATMDADLDKAPQACVATTNMERAISLNYRKDTAASRLVEAYELCFEFDRAKALRASFPDLASQPPYANNRWQVDCNGQPEVLMRALAAKYDDYHISQRLAKFYTACGRPDEAKAKYDIAVVSAAKLEQMAPLLEMDMPLAMAFAQVGKGSEAASQMAMHLKILDIIDEDPTRPAFSRAIDEAAEFYGQLVQKFGDSDSFSTLKQNVDALRARRTEIATNRTRDEEVRVSRCDAIASGINGPGDEAAQRSQMTPVDQYIAIWDGTCKSYRRMWGEAIQNKCGGTLIDGLNSLANTAHHNAKKAADDWEREYLEHYSVDCTAL